MSIVTCIAICQITVLNFVKHIATCHCGSVVVNDILLNVTSVIKLYADDILLYHTINSEADCILIQKDINNFI